MDARSIRDVSGMPAVLQTVFFENLEKYLFFHGSIINYEIDAWGTNPVNLLLNYSSGPELRLHQANSFHSGVKKAVTGDGFALRLALQSFIEGETSWGGGR